MALMISRFRKSTCRFSSSGKRRCTDRGILLENTGNFTCDPRQHESTECGFHPLQRSLWHFSVPVSACARVSRWRSYLNSPGWRSVSLACRSSSTSRRSFSFSISASLSRIPFELRRQSHKAPSTPLPPPQNGGIPCSASSEWFADTLKISASCFC